MNNIEDYPYTSPILMTDSIFVNYGGHTGSSTAAQRQAMYLLAEMKASEDISTFFAQTIITGTYPYNRIITLDHARVSQVLLTRFIDFEETIYYTVSGTGNVYVNLWNEEYGLIDLQYAIGNCHCHGDWRPYPYKVQIVYKTGIPSGISYQPNILLALSTYTDILLNELTGFGNEAPGDASIVEFANQEYREKRRGLINTVFGGSPRAVFAHNLLSNFRRYRFVGI